MTHTHTHFSLFCISIFLRSTFLLLLLFVFYICPFVLYLSSVLYIFLLFLLSWHSSPFILASFFLSYIDTLNATPLDEGSARRRDLYLTTHRHSCRRRDSNPQSKQAGGHRPTPQTARPLNLAIISSADVKYNSTTSEPKP